MSSPGRNRSPRGRIERSPRALADEGFDAIVVGGGVYGIAILVEAARRGLRALLLERGDFGSGTSHNSLRIVHGGLRYLQSADLPRYRESVDAQNWFFDAVPGFVEPLPCLMPLYDEGIYRCSLFRPALAANSMLARALSSPLPRGRVASAAETRRAFPAVDERGLRGAALWYDAFAPNTPRLFIELVRSACGSGAAALNYVEAVGLLETGGGVEGVQAVDLESGAEHEFRAPIVINATGPWSRSFSERCGVERAELFEPSIAWNLLFDREAPSDHALALRPRERGSHVYFAVPWKGALLVGTGHAPWSGGVEKPLAPAELLEAFIADLDRAAPALALGRSDVLRVFTGLLPAARPGTAELKAREVIHDHGASGGPRGLWSLCGVKLTVAAQVAGKVLARAIPDAKETRREGPLVAGCMEHDVPLFWTPEPGDDAWHEPLRRAIEEEAVVHLDDLLLRRSSLGDHPGRARSLAAQTCRLFDWSEERSRSELARLEQVISGPSAG